MKISTDNFLKDLIYQNEQEQPITNQYKNPNKEFIICLLPSYIFLIAAFFRYCTTLRKSQINNSHNISVSNLKAFVYLMCCSYLANLLLGLFNNSAINLDPKQDKLAFLYIIPIISWYISFKLTNSEVSKKITPACYSQYLFYSLSEIAFVYKLISEPEVNTISFRHF